MGGGSVDMVSKYCDVIISSPNLHQNLQAGNPQATPDSTICVLTLSVISALEKFDNSKEIADN